jgi:hypothetical protein
MCAHENTAGRYASFCAPVKDFLGFDSISTTWQSAALVGNGPMLQEDSLTPISVVAICVRPNPVIGCDHL